MRTLIVVALALAIVPLVVAPVAAADPLDPHCIPEAPCCATIVCVPPNPEPCRIGQYYYC